MHENHQRRWVHHLKTDCPTTPSTSALMFLLALPLDLVSSILFYVLRIDINFDGAVWNLSTDHLFCSVETRKSWLVNVSAACKELYRLCKEEVLWKSKYPN